MARLYQSGTLNTSDILVPNLYVQIVPPQSLVLSGVTTGRIGIVGTAGWGPVGQPVAVGTMGDYLSTFGPKQGTTTDAGLAVNIALIQGASDFRVVRVTDGTDRAASASIEGVGLGARYTGSQGNALTLTISPSGAGYAACVSHPVLGVYNYAGTDWTSMASAINADSGALVQVSLPTTVPALTGGTVVFSGGLDGEVPPTAAYLGTQGASTTGMYALQGQGCAIGVLHGLSDPASWTTQAALGESEGIYMVCSGPANDVIANAVSIKASAGLDSYAVKLMFGDWLWWNDDTNGLMLVSAQGFAAGCLGALSPEQSSLNKQLYGVVGSQKAGLSSGRVTTVYSDSELAALFGAGIDVVCNPAPGGTYWSVRCGHNASSNSTISGDNYTKLTNFLAESLASGMGAYVGEVVNATLFDDIRASILGLLSNLLSQGILGSVNGSLPYSVICDTSNNSAARLALGYVQCDVQIQYQGINEKFIVNLQGGTSVTVTSSAGTI